jgi:hypothetical protein
MMKLRSVDFGVRLPFEEVTDVAPRLVTPPVTVWVRLVFSAPEVVAGTSIEWLWCVVSVCGNGNGVRMGVGNVGGVRMDICGVRGKGTSVIGYRTNGSKASDKSVSHIWKGKCPRYDAKDRC